MSLTDWTWSGVTPLLEGGTGALILSGAPRGSGETISAWGVRIGAPRFFVSGRARGVFHTSTFASGPPAFGGFHVLADTGGIPRYLCGLEINPTGEQHFLAISRYNGSVANRVQLWRGADLSTTPAVAFQVTWLMDTENLGGMHFSVESGGDLDSLVPVLGLEGQVDFLEEDLEESFGEGPICYTGTGVQHDFIFADIEIVPVTFTVNEV